MRHPWLLAGVLAVGLSSGCADSSPPGQAPRAESAAARFGGFAGMVRETGNYLALAVLDGRARAFVCDNVDEIWMEGQVSKDGVVTLQGPDKKRIGFFNTLQGMGAYWYEGKLRTFNATPVDQSAGLYRAQSPNRPLVGGWVVLPNGDQVGVVTDNGVEQPAPPIKPGQGTVTIGGQQLALKSGLQQLSGGG